MIYKGFLPFTDMDVLLDASRTNNSVNPHIINISSL
jgi:hypothetical protein